MVNSEIIGKKDGLTGYHTKQSLYEYLSSRTQLIYSRARKLSIIILDLDNFKAINDTHGHLVGDDALRHFCMAINIVLKGQHFVARYGGDEFVIVVDDAHDGREGIEVAKRIKATLKKEKFFTPKGYIRIQSSIGIASYPDDAKTPRGLLEMADQALYYAKAHGRNKTITTKSLKKYSVKDKMFTLAKWALILFFILIAVVSYRGAKSFRGIIDYCQNVSQNISYIMHKNKASYNYSSVNLKDGKRISGWVIHEDSEKIVLTMTKPNLNFNPLKFKLATSPITIPRSEVVSSINILKE